MVPASRYNALSLHISRSLHSTPSLTRASIIAGTRARQLSNHLVRSSTTTMPSLFRKNKTESTKDKAAIPEAPPVPPVDQNMLAGEPQKTEQEKPADEGTSLIDGPVPDIYNHLPKLPSDWPAKHELFVHSNPVIRPDLSNRMSIFTAGSIEMGRAILWQERLVEVMRPLPITVCNPRRGAWKIHKTPGANEKAFRDQVEWELDCLHAANVICFYFDRETLSPVTMLELGLWASSGKVVVCCPEGFWKGGNVEMVCERYGIPFARNFTDLVPLIMMKLYEKGMPREWTLPLDKLPKVTPLPKPAPPKPAPVAPEKEADEKDTLATTAPEMAAPQTAALPAAPASH